MRSNWISCNDLYLLTVFGIVRIASALPGSRAKSLIVEIISFAAFHLSRSKRRRMEENLACIFGNGLTCAQRRTIARESFREYWNDIFSLRLSKEERTALHQVEIVGMDYLTAALAKGCGVILLESSFFGKRYLTKHLLGEFGIAVHQVHHEQHLGGFQIGSPTWMQKQFLRPMLERTERSFISEIIYVPDSDSLAFTKQLVNALKKNEAICVSGDGKRGHKHISLALLGRSVKLPTGMMSLGRLSGAPLVPVFCFQSQERKTRLVIERPLEVNGSAQREEWLFTALTLYLGILELYIKKYPGSYRNWQLADY